MKIKDIKKGDILIRKDNIWYENNIIKVIYIDFNSNMINGRGGLGYPNYYFKRKATKLEEEAYNQGIRNTRDITPIVNIDNILII